jgi:hypothetical protein
VLFGEQAVKTRPARARILSMIVVLFISSLSFCSDMAVSDDGGQDLVPVSFGHISIDHLSNYGKRKMEITFPSLATVERSGMI